MRICFPSGSHQFASRSDAKRGGFFAKNRAPRGVDLKYRGKLPKSSLLGLLGYLEEFVIWATILYGLGTRILFRRIFDKEFWSMASQRSLVLLKPDCVERRLMGQIISRFENKGLSIVAMKMLRVTPELSQKHYAEHVSKPFYPSLEAFIISAPVVALAVEGPEVIRVIRDMLGATNGLNAAPGTIRGEFSSSRQMNLVHASDSPESAERELNLYFSANEFCPAKLALADIIRAPEEN